SAPPSRSSRPTSSSSGRVAGRDRVPSSTAQGGTMRAYAIIVAVLVTACAGRGENADVGSSGGAATAACGNSKVSLPRFDRRVKPGAGFSFDVTVTTTSCASAPIQLRASYPEPDGTTVGADLTSLWTLPSS